MSESASPDERWLAVPGWDGFYDVSDLGRVRSYPRMTPWGLRGGRMLKLNLRGPHLYPYKGVTLCAAGTKWQVKVHQLVMLAFGEPAPAGATDIRHLNGDRMDCSFTNLAWGTHRENGQDMIDHGHANGPGDGSAHPRAKLTEAIAIEARSEYATGQVTERALAKRHGVNVSTMHRLLTRQTWDHV